MRFLRFLILAAVTCAFALPAVANDTPPPAPPGATSAQPPAPAPAAPSPAPAPAPAARKEEDAQAGLLARLKAHVKGTGAMANEVATLQDANAKLQARVKDLENGTELKALRDENAAMKADITAYIESAQTHGLLPEKTGNNAPQPPQSPAGQAAANAVAGAVSTQLAALGVKTSALPPAAPVPGGQAASLAEVEEQLKACKTDRERQAVLTKHSALILASN
jgi:hypothetical protein